MTALESLLNWIESHGIATELAGATVVALIVVWWTNVRSRLLPQQVTDILSIYVETLAALLVPCLGGVVVGYFVLQPLATVVVAILSAALFVSMLNPHSPLSAKHEVQVTLFFAVVGLFLAIWLLVVGGAFEAVGVVGALPFGQELWGLYGSIGRILLTVMQVTSGVMSEPHDLSLWQMETILSMYVLVLLLGVCFFCGLVRGDRPWATNRATGKLLGCVQRSAGRGLELMWARLCHVKWSPVPVPQMC